MILYLTIAIIIWLALTCVYFINDARKARDDAEDYAWSATTYEFGRNILLKRIHELESELQKWKRPRARNGRFK